MKNLLSTLKEEAICGCENTHRKQSKHTARYILYTYGTSHSILYNE